MSKIVRIKEGVVCEVIPEYALPVEKWYGTKFAVQCMKAPNEVEQGWVYLDGAFIDPAVYTLDQLRQTALQRIDGKCSAAIYSGVTIGDKHYKLTPTAQGNLATAQAKVDSGEENVIYAADNEEPTLHTAEQISAISDAAYKWGVVNTSYYAKLQKWIARETDTDILASIDYGVKLPDDLMQELGELLTGAGINLADYVGLLNGGN